MTQPRGYHGRFSSQPLHVRFSEKFIRGGPDECWLWTGATTAIKGKRDYKQGHIGFAGATLSSSRAAWLVFNGEIPTGVHVLHNCDNPLCVNPSHLFLGTNADNIADRIKKGRSTRGEKDGAAKLTAEQVIAIALAKGTGREIARRFAISTAQVCRIRRHQTWRHLWVRAAAEEEGADVSE